MIGKAIRKPGESGSGGAADAFAPAVAYICGKATEIVLRNFMSTDWRYAAADIMRAAEMNTRVQRPFYHLVLCWQPDERPTPDDQMIAMEMMLERLGLEEHQVVIATHDDRDHLHVHAAINTVHPATGKVWSKKHDHARIEKACREIEHHFGWPHDNGRFDITISKNGDVQLRPAYDRWKQKEAERASGSRKPTSADIAFEREHGLPSFAQSVPDGLRARFGDIATTAQSWPDLHAVLDGIGLVYLRKGSGAVIGIIGSAETAKASAFGQAFTFSRMEKRLGPYVGPPEVVRPVEVPDVGRADASKMLDSLEVATALPQRPSAETKAAGFKLTLLRRTYTDLFLDETVAAQIRYVDLTAVPPFITFRSGGKVVDLGSRITTTAKGDDAIKLMVAMAIAKGWSGVIPSGSPAFVRQAAIIAAEAGLPVSGVPADIQELADGILAKLRQAQGDADAVAVTTPDVATNMPDAADPSAVSQAVPDVTPAPEADAEVVSDTAATIPAAPVAAVDDHHETGAQQQVTTEPADTEEKPAPSQQLKTKAANAAGSARIWQNAPHIDPEKPNLASVLGVSAATLDRFALHIRIGVNGTLMFACRHPRSGELRGIQRENINGRVETRGHASIATLGNPETAKRVVFVTSGLNALALAELENSPETLYVSLQGLIDDQVAKDLKSLCRKRNVYDARRPVTPDQDADQDLLAIIPDMLDLSAACFDVGPLSHSDSWVHVLKLHQANSAPIDEIVTEEEPTAPSDEFDGP